jgi:NAD(P)H dehydrogenase (quinone)
MTKVVVVFHSGDGHTKRLAHAALRGAKSVAGVTADIVEIHGTDVRDGRWKNDAAIATLAGADAIIFGCPTYMGDVSAVFKAFLEWAFNPWMKQEWKDKFAGAFTNSASQSGDKLNSLQSLVIFGMQMSMIWVGVGDPPGNNWSGGSRNDNNRLGTWIGAMGQSNSDGDDTVEPPDSDCVTVERLARRIALITKQFREGGNHVTERITGR